ERMLGINVRCYASRALCIRDDMEREGGFAAGFGAIDLSDAAARNTADADRCIQVDSACRDRLDSHLTLGAEPHDGPLAAGLFDLRNGQIQRFFLVVRDRRDSHRAHILSLVVNTLAKHNRTGNTVASIPEENTKTARLNQPERATLNASSTCRMRTRSPVINTPTTSKRYASSARPWRSIQTWADFVNSFCFRQLTASTG